MIVISKQVVTADNLDTILDAILAIVACLTLGALSLVYGPTTPKLW